MLPTFERASDEQLSTTPPRTHSQLRVSSADAYDDAVTHAAHVSPALTRFPRHVRFLRYYGESSRTSQGESRNKRACSREGCLERVTKSFYHSGTTSLLYIVYFFRFVQTLIKFPVSGRGPTCLAVYPPRDLFRLPRYP